MNGPVPDSDPPDETNGSTYADDATLGGYFRVHDRPPAFEGLDGHPYTVSIEIERTGDLRHPYTGYLVFPRWAETGVGIIGHVETPDLTDGASEAAVRGTLEELTLFQVQALLEHAISEAKPPFDD